MRSLTTHSSSPVNPEQNVANFGVTSYLGMSIRVTVRTLHRFALYPREAPQSLHLIHFPNFLARHYARHDSTYYRYVGYERIPERSPLTHPRCRIAYPSERVGWHADGLAESCGRSAEASRGGGCCILYQRTGDGVVRSGRERRCRARRPAWHGR